MDTVQPTLDNPEPVPEPVPEPDQTSQTESAPESAPPRRGPKWRRVGKSIDLVNTKDLMPGDFYEGGWNGTGIHEWPNGETTQFFTLETRKGPKSFPITAAFKELIEQARLGDWVRITFRGKKAVKNGRTMNVWDCEIADGGDPDLDQSDQDDDDEAPF